MAVEPNLSGHVRHTMISTGENTKFCWICGQDIAAELCTIDENGLSVHKSCREKQTLLHAASRATDLWRELQPKARRSVMVSAILRGRRIP